MIQVQADITQGKRIKAAITATGRIGLHIGDNLDIFIEPCRLRELIDHLEAVESQLQHQSKQKIENIRMMRFVTPALDNLPNEVLNDAIKRMIAEAVVGSV